MSMKKLLDLSKEEQDNFLNSFDIILADIDGVLFNNFSTEIEGSSNAVKNLRYLGKEVYFVTNNSLVSIERQVERFKGFETSRNEFILPATGVIGYLKKIKFDKTVYLVGFEYLKNQLEEAGFKVDYDKVQPIPETGEGWASIVKNLNPDVGAVVMDFCFNVCYTHLQRSIEYINLNKAIFLLGGGDDRGVAFNTTIIGTMPFANIVTDFTGVTPQILAKPGEALKEVLKEKLRLLDPKRVIFIGDTVDIDLGFAAKCGYQKVLTLTGNAKPEVLSDWKYDETFKPDYVLDTMKDLEVITSRKLQE